MTSIVFTTPELIVDGVVLARDVPCRLDLETGQVEAWKEDGENWARWMFRFDMESVKTIATAQGVEVAGTLRTVGNAPESLS